MISHLGLYKPASHLTADTFEENKNRSWRTSDIDCFASNLAFVLFDCADGEHVLTLHQEHAIVMPMCQSELCPLRVLTQHFNQSIHNCDYSDMCSLRGEL
ncbi:putative multiple inositol polyphosphate phosphatase 1 [Operophtera brumata]|uniref:Putative multiple inositol polyphosphate phosphatase 1 n=1 Tax=Operophtera brumata TaxID=104452 RepID=A0A0L7KNP8_OPEBR|nr:putative multiple inositol polyphosphate phosphatase 1 [Operophtera brumata]